MAASPYPAYGPAGDRGTRRPGKRSAAGRSTSERVPVFMPDGGFALSGLRVQPVTAGPVGPASAAPPGGEQQSGCLSLCRMAASPYPANGSAGDHRTRRPGKRSAAGR
ncbi:hypothetical protein LNP20_11735 [Klebsiella pneumoniae subsp. pneumoniae]|nr:hypothetical protein [Klebsiella pneumoniae subsp. pneumoniae]